MTDIIEDVNYTVTADVNYTVQKIPKRINPLRKHKMKGHPPGIPSRMITAV